MKDSATYIGSVQDVSGTTVRATLSNVSLSGLIYVNGDGYRIGRVGSFIKAPDLFGIITQVGARVITMLNKNGRCLMTLQFIRSELLKNRF